MENQSIHAAGNAKGIQRRHPRPRSGIAQLSLVEHALCALDPALSLVGGYQHQTGYFYTDANQRRFAHVTVSAPLGLSSRDEYFLWGLLALTFNQPQPSIEFLATPHYCLKQLGYLEVKGGKQYAEFRATIKRLAGVYYQCDAFYDPRLQTFQDAGFGFLKYSLPQHDDSSRAWRIVWDPLFFEYVQRTGGKLSLGLTTPLTVAAGANPNPFFETASVQQPIVSPSAMLNDVMLEPTFVYDIPTEPGRTYVFAAK